MSNIKIVLEPNISPMSFEQFKKHSPGYSISIDGYVSEGPNEVQISEDGPRQNLNHHEGVYRAATLATCQQSLMAIRTGFFKTFKTKNGRCLNIYANDCDEDICATTFCFTNSHLVENTINPIINRFIQVTGIMDATGGAYPMPIDLPYLEEHAWIVEPYLKFRQQGGLNKFRTAQDFNMVIEQVHCRIMQHILGQGKRISLNTEYEILRRGTGWALVKEIGTRARLKMFNDGINAFVSVSERNNNNLTATVGKFSGYINFPIIKILNSYNEFEGLTDVDDKAGGSDLIGGTSRKNGTKLTLDQIFDITENIVKQNNKLM